MISPKTNNTLKILAICIPAIISIFFALFVLISHYSRSEGANPVKFENLELKYEQLVKAMESKANKDVTAQQFENIELQLTQINLNIRSIQEYFKIVPRNQQK